ncbi:hypothetical protein [Burkholderia ubonensis]|uniref:hypothetical protein n=1 Tax=Burkholderia ubonensis TaxID=101571 RepID=UPI0018DF2730|nr:hypothetical protein [Burkholderia ubonensis]
MASKYGNMPANPNLIAKVRGDAGEYPVLGVDWFSNRVLLDRTITRVCLHMERTCVATRRAAREARAAANTGRIRKGRNAASGPSRGNPKLKFHSRGMPENE